MRMLFCAVLSMAAVSHFSLDAMERDKIAARVINIDLWADKIAEITNRLDQMIRIEDIVEEFGETLSVEIVIKWLTKANISLFGKNSCMGAIRLSEFAFYGINDKTLKVFLCTAQKIGNDEQVWEWLCWKDVYGRTVLHQLTANHIDAGAVEVVLDFVNKLGNGKAWQLINQKNNAAYSVWDIDKAILKPIMEKLKIEPCPD